MTENTDKKPMEMSLEDASSAEQLTDIMNKKAKEKLELQGIPGLYILKKSKFYYGNNNNLREQIANYKGYAILIKQELIKEEINDKENKLFPSLVTLPDLKLMKKVNGNIIRKINPNSLHEFEKMTLIQAIIPEIDKLL